MIGEGAPSAPPALRASIAWGALGGLVGAAILAVVALVTPVPGTGGAPFFVVSAQRFGVHGAAGWGAGSLLHFLTGLLAGAAFGGLVGGGTDHLRLTSSPRALLRGVLYGFLLWVFFFGSLMSYHVPGWEAMYSMDGGALLGHLLFRAAIGAFAFYGAPARAALLVCRECGRSFTSPESGVEHLRTDHAGAPGAVSSLARLP